MPASRAVWRSRAATTRSRTPAEDGAALAAQRAPRTGGPTVTDDVDAVEQRPAEPAVVAGEVGGASSGSAASPIPHGHGFDGGDEHDARREDHHPLGADDRHAAVLERLAQRLERRRG